MKKLSLSVGLLILLTTVTFAQSPGGSSACNELSGKAKGLCNAYCEAMDCDSAEPNASETACQTQYGAIMETTGEEPPCVGDASAPTVECPCAAEWWRMDLYPESPTDVSCTSMPQPSPLEGSIFQLDVRNSPTVGRTIAFMTGDPDAFGFCVPLGQITCGEHFWTCASGGGVTGIEGGTLLFNHYPQRPESYSLFQQLLSDVCEQEIRLIAAEFDAECLEW